MNMQRPRSCSYYQSCVTSQRFRSKRQRWVFSWLACPIQTSFNEQTMTPSFYNQSMNVEGISPKNRLLLLR
jgi:hypothetical protein